MILLEIFGVFGYAYGVGILTENYLTRGFWGDEAWTALISSFPMQEIVRVTAEDFHPPFYYFLVHGFIQVFGASEWIRLISTLFFLLTPLPVYFLAKQWLGKNLARLAAVLVLVSPILFTYAFEARAYALVAFISAFLTLAFWKALTTRLKKWFWLYFILGSIGVYAHYYMWFILAAHGIYWLIFEKSQWQRVVLTFGGIGLAQLPWVPSLLSQVKSVTENYWIGPIDKRTHWEFFIRVTGGDHGTPQQMFTVFSVLVFLVLSVIGMSLGKKHWPKGYIFLWMWLLVPVVLPSLISLYRPVFFYRYLIFSTIPILLISLWGLYALRDSLAFGAGAFVLALYLSINVLSFGRYPHTMREELDNIFEETPTQDFKLVTVLPSFAEVMYYNQGRKIVQVLPLGLVQFSGKSLLDAFVRQGKIEVKDAGEDETYWLIEPGPTSTFHP